MTMKTTQEASSNRHVGTMGTGMTATGLAGDGVGLPGMVTTGIADPFPCLALVPYTCPMSPGHKAQGQTP